MRPLEDYEKLIGYRFQNKQLLKPLLTHSSFANEHKCKSYERLEFLGDSVLELRHGEEYLFEAFPQLPEGQLTKTLGRPCLRARCLSKALHYVGDFLLRATGSAEWRPGAPRKVSAMSTCN